jgi:hypothetical protein
MPQPLSPSLLMQFNAIIQNLTETNEKLSNELLHLRGVLSYAKEQGRNQEYS